MTESVEQDEFQRSVDLKDPVLAAFLAWLVPGLGHLYQGRLAKAGLFFVCILGTFVYGLYLGSDRGGRGEHEKDLGWGRVVYCSWRTTENQGSDKRLPYLCQVGVGLPALPALVQASRMKSGKPVLWNGFMAPPWLPMGLQNDPNRDQPTSSELNKGLNRGFELGTVYTMVAGLLNILVIYDAWGGPVFSETARKEDEEEDEDEQEDQPRAEEGETDSEKTTESNS